MEKAKKGDWVQIKSVELRKEHRGRQIPPDTRNCDLVKWVKGWLIDDARLGDTVEITTITGRRERGELFAIKPGYTHGYGRHVPELTQVQRQLHTFLTQGEE